jgi:hypothetical protein
MAIAYVAVTLLIAAPVALATDKSVANEARAAKFAQKDFANMDREHVAQQRVGVNGLEPAFLLQLQAASETKDGVMLVQESRMSRLHRQRGRYGQSRGTYFYNGGPSYYYGNAYYQNGFVFYAQGYDNAYARGTGYVNDLHAARERTKGSGRVISWHQHRGLPGCRDHHVLMSPEVINAP